MWLAERQPLKKEVSAMRNKMLKRVTAVAAATMMTFLAMVPGTKITHAQGNDDVIKLRVCNWEEYIDLGDWDEEERMELENGAEIFGENSMVDDFTEWYYETYGKRVEVEYSCFGTNEDLYNQLTLGDVYDLVCPSDYMIMKLMAEKKLVPFSEDFYDTDNPDNYYVRGVSDYIKDTFDENEIGGESWSKYAAGYMWGVTGVLYNPEKMTEEEASTWDVFLNDKFVVMSEGRMQQIGTPEDIYNEPKNAFVADFIGESNIFTGIMTDKLKVRFCGAEFACVDDVEHGRLVEVVVRPEDVEITTPENGAITGTVTSVVFKGVHYEITVESGKNEIVIQSTKTAAVGSQVGLNVEPDGIHIMIPEHTLNKIESDVDKNYELTIFDGKIQCDLTKIIPGSKFNDAHELLDAHGDVIDYEKLKVVLAIKPRHISMSDNEEEGIVCGHIINLIYKGDHYSYVVRTDMDEDFIVNDEYLWNMDDYVSLVIPEEHIQFSIKK
jgi:ABC-type Fe3+/spermidine/putrescine transport system ATPase subunit